MMNCLDREIEAMALARMARAHNDGFDDEGATVAAARIMAAIDHKHDVTTTSLCIGYRNYAVDLGRAKHRGLAYFGLSCQEIVEAECDMDPARVAVWPEARP